MHAHGIRHTFVTDEDIENLKDKWTINKEGFSINNVSGYHETSFVSELPKQFKLLGRDLELLRITYRSGEDMGDLLLSDTFPGTTVEYLAKATHSGSEYELQEFLALFSGLGLVSSKPETKTAFIDVAGKQVYHASGHISRDFAKQIASCIPGIHMDVIQAAPLSEITYNAHTDSFRVRIVDHLNKTTKIESSSVETEIGLVQRQKRALEDSEYKGLSTYLPADDLGM